MSFEAATAARAQMLVVHHGLFWGEPMAGRFDLETVFLDLPMGA